MYITKLQQGVVMDPAMFRWYAADLTQAEYMRNTPRSFFIYIGSFILVMYMIVKVGIISAVCTFYIQISGSLSIQQNRKRTRVNARPANNFGGIVLISDVHILAEMLNHHRMNMDGGVINEMYSTIIQRNLLNK